MQSKQPYNPFRPQQQPLSFYDGTMNKAQLFDCAYFYVRRKGDENHLAGQVQ